MFIHARSLARSLHHQHQPSVAIYGYTRAKRTRLVYEHHTSGEFPLQLKGGQSHCRRYTTAGAEIQFGIVLEHRSRELRKTQWAQFNAPPM